MEEDECELPRTEVERLLAGIWSDLLHAPYAGRHSNFFRIGGDSLRATQLVARLRQAPGVELPLQVLFDRPTIAGLAGWIESQRGQ